MHFFSAKASMRFRLSRKEQADEVRALSHEEQLRCEAVEP